MNDLNTRLRPLVVALFAIALVASGLALVQTAGAASSPTISAVVADSSTVRVDGTDFPAGDTVAVEMLLNGERSTATAVVAADGTFTSDLTYALGASGTAEIVARTIDGPLVTADESEPPANTTAPPPTTTTTTTVPIDGSDDSGIGMAIPGYQLIFQSPAELEADLDRLEDLGVTWLRFDVATAFFVEDEVYKWAELDRTINAIDARGIKILGIMTQLPNNHSGGDWRVGPTTDLQRQSFATYAEAAASRYDGVVDAWEVWNEPNLDHFWAPNANTAQYVELLKLAYPALKAGAADTPVLTGGLGWTSGDPGQPDILSTTFVTEMYALGAKDYFDILAVHPYPNLDEGANSGEMLRASQIRSIMDSNGDSAKPIWATELGAPTQGVASVTEAEHATLYQDLYDQWETMPNGGPMFYYTLNDMNIDSREGHFGIVRLDNTTKPAYDTMKQLVLAL
jgi:hypothetical protein